MDIKSYISTSRNEIGTATLHEYYNQIFSSLNTGFPELKLELAYSTNRHCEIIQWKGEEFLIYDQYLGQTFNELNKIYFGAETGDVGLIFCKKIIGEYLLLLGYMIPSVAFGYHFQNSKQIFSRIKGDIHKEYSLFTGIQEYFVMAHEISHKILKKHGTEDVYKTTKELLRKNQLNYFEDENFPMDDFIENFSEGIIQGLKMDNERRKEVTKKVREQIKVDPEAFFSHREHLIENRKDFLEEVICDEIATNLILKKNLSSPQTTIRAIFIGIMHIRLLSIGYRMVADIKEDTKKLNDFFLEMVLRLSVFRTNFETTFHYKYGKNEMMELANLLTKDNKRYSRFITDQLLFSIKIDLNEIKKQKAAIFKKKYTFQERKELNSLITKLMQ